jgi:hypothetical protein
MSVLRLLLLADLQQKFVVSRSSRSSIVILENTLNRLVNRKRLVMVTLTAGIIFLLFTFMRLRVWGVLRRWSACAPTDRL